MFAGAFGKLSLLSPSFLIRSAGAGFAYDIKSVLFAVAQDVYFGLFGLVWDRVLWVVGKC